MHKLYHTICLGKVVCENKTKQTGFEPKCKTENFNLLFFSTLTDKKKIKLEIEDELDAADDSAVKKEDTNNTEMLRCETCGVVFRNLVLFMDHKNTRCDSGMLNINRLLSKI